MREEIVDIQTQVVDFIEESSTTNGLWRESWCVAGLPVDNVSTREVLELLEHAGDLPQKTVINTPNLNFLRRLRSEPDFHQALLASDLLIPDGMPVLWLARLLGAPMRERVAGSTVVSSLIHRENASPISLFFFGGDPGVAKKAHRICNSVLSPVISAGYFNPGWGSVEELSEEDHLRKISESSPDILLVSLPAAKSVPWINACKHKVRAKVFIASGITVSFIAGAVKRAPKLVQKIGLEWAWRIKEEPRLARRYAVDALWLLRELFLTFLPLLAMSRWYGRQSIVRSGSFIVEHQEQAVVSIALPPVCDLLNVDSFLHTCEELLEEQIDIVLDAQNTQFLDSRFLGSLLVLRKIQAERNRKLTMINSSRPVSLLLKFHSVGEAFS